jgi:hypothetical protein
MLIVIFTFLFISHIYADDYHHTITAIDVFNIQLTTGKTPITQFTLSNGTKWIIDHKSRFTGQKPFEVDTELFIYPNLKPSLGGLDDFTIRFLDEEGNKKAIPAWVMDSSCNKLQSITKIEKVLVQEGGWFTSNEYDYYIYLSDNTMWKAAKNSDVSRWKIDDKILVSALDPSFEKWVVINVKRKKLSTELMVFSLIVEHCEAEFIPSDS